MVVSSLTPVPICPLSTTYPASPPHGVLEQLGQDVVQWHRDEGESSSHMSIDTDAGGIAILVLTQASVGRSKGSDLDQWFSTGGTSSISSQRNSAISKDIFACHAGECY